jgi:hypothetical protein
MKAKISILAVILTLIVSTGLAQEKSKKQIKEEKKIEKQKKVEDMINAKEFVFIGRHAMPTGYKTVNLTTNTNFVKFHPYLIESYMPYFGRVYSGAGYGGDSGIKFEQEPEEYTVVKQKKNYLINASVKAERDTYKLTLTVGFEGSATLIITSNTRSAISYSGEISEPEKKEEKN